MENEMELYRVGVDHNVVAWFREKDHAVAWADELYDVHGDEVTIGQPYTFTPLVYGAAGWTAEIKVLDERERGTHLSHCCQRCGCKYGEDEICPVYADKAATTYPENNGCEMCEIFAKRESKWLRTLNRRLDNEGKSIDDWNNWLSTYVSPDAWEDVLFGQLSFEQLYNVFAKDVYTKRENT